MLFLQRETNVAIHGHTVRKWQQSVNKKSIAINKKWRTKMQQKAPDKDYDRIRRRLFKMVSVGVVDDRLNQSYDVISTAMLLINLIITFANTFAAINTRYGKIVGLTESVTVFFFAADYILRLLTAHNLYPNVSEIRALAKYVFSFSGIVDLLSFLPYYLPVFFPAGAAVFRMFRVVRILRLFRINAYYDSLNVITEVLSAQKQQLLSSGFIIVTLMMASSLCMYSVEHEAQPEIFKNAFSGIWWAASTLLTVGYGDIYPVTSMGRFLGIIISFLGVGMVAIPTGIISAGFVEQYSRLKRIGDYSEEEDIHFIKIQINEKDSWNGVAIKKLQLPHGVIIAVVQRDSRVLIPHGDQVIRAGDILILGAESIGDHHPINIKEVLLKEHHPWNGVPISKLDISRRTCIVMVKRNGRTLIPKGNLVLQEGDMVCLYSQKSTQMTSEDYTY